MAYDYSDLISNVEGWAQQAVKQGWIDTAEAMSLSEEPQDSANALFVDDIARPLVVAFMGGTGVGKSSLLNKLAGQSIARTGVERPTSREVTLYYHQSIDLYQLEERFPLQQIQLSQHTETANEKIIWIDMPETRQTPARGLSTLHGVEKFSIVFSGLQSDVNKFYGGNLMHVMHHFAQDPHHLQFIGFG